MFSHLHVHSHYSLLDGLPKITEIINQALKYKMPAVALTDHGAMYGAIEFYKSAKEYGIKPIIGLEAYVSPYPLKNKKAWKERKRYHLTLLAKNQTGYQNLMALTSAGWLEGFYYKPRIDKKLLRKHSKGLIALSGCAAGEINQAVLNNQKDKAVKLIKEYQDIFGQKNFFLEIQDHPEITEYQKLKKIIPELSNQFKIPLIATNDVHYLNKKDKTAQDVLLCIQTNKKLDETNRLTLTDSNYHFASPAEMQEKFSKLPSALENTQLIVEKCQLNLELGKWVFPAVETPKNISPDNFLKKRAFNELKEKLNLDQKEKLPKKYQKRLKYELDIIKTKGYAPYFLVVSDIANFARSKEIITTTRGSAAGSLVSYSIGITTADPMDFNLPFERFLNPYRPSPPDIDLDIEDARRGELIQYLQEKYGKEKVAHIITFGTLLARAAVRDVGRVLGLPYSFCDKIAKMVPIGSQGFKMNLERALSENPELKNAYNENQDVKKIIDLAKQIEGCVRHASLHAAGIVIAPNKLTNFTPLQKDSKQGEITTQYDMHAVEEAGLLKMDLLGITNLSILGLAREIIKRTQNVDLDIHNLDLNDQKTYQLLTKGQTMGVFQLSGSGMTYYLKEMKPNNIFDIMAMISLYRPGPMESIPEFIKRKHNPELVTYPHPKLKEILKTSYGVITYQDDVLLTAITLAGYNWKEADKLRKAIGKKIIKEMAAQKNKFINGCIEHSGLTKNQALKIWRLIEPFAAYGFNKAHASSYALVAYQTAYVKANFTVEFMAALLTCESGNMDKIAAGINECEELNIKVFLPDINESLKGFTVVKNKHGKQNIRFGLQAIKHLGSNVMNEIITKRKKNGPFKTLENFLSRINNINKKSLEALIRSGALDCFNKRKILDYNIQNMLNFAKIVRQEKESAKISLFSKNELDRSLKLKKPSEDFKYPTLIHEKEYLGLYITSHPLKKYKPYLKNKTIVSCEMLNNLAEKQKIKIIGIINQIKKIKTKKGNLMLFAQVEDFSGNCELIVFPKILEKKPTLWQKEKKIIISGQVSKKDESTKIIVQKAKELNEKNLLQKSEKKNSQENKNEFKQKDTGFFIALPAKLPKTKLKKLKKTLKQNNGLVPVYLRIDKERVKILKTRFKVKPSEELKNKINKILN